MTKSYELVINADDFGMTHGVISGIVSAIEFGCVKTASVMTCDPEMRETIADHADRLAGRLGVHLQLTDGSAVGAREKVGSLIDERGVFPRRLGFGAKLDSIQVLEEWRAQIKLARELGVKPTHIDTHHDVHWREGALEAYIELAREEGLPCRSGPAWLTRRLSSPALRRGELCETFGDASEISVDGLVAHALQMAARCPPGSRLELACHPGHVDDALRGRTHYVDSREAELEVLCRPELLERLQKAGMNLAVEAAG